RRHAARLGVTIVDHPAPFEAERRIDLAPFGTEVAVALLVFADQLTEPPGPKLGAEGLAVPPREYLQKKQFHGRGRFEKRVAALMPSAGRKVQLSPDIGYPARSNPRFPTGRGGDRLSRRRGNARVAGTADRRKG